MSAAYAKIIAALVRGAMIDCIQLDTSGQQHAYSVDAFDHQLFRLAE
jgi:hypothetical protein